MDFANEYLGGSALKRGCVQVTVYITTISFSFEFFWFSYLAFAQ